MQAIPRNYPINNIAVQSDPVQTKAMVDYQILKEPTGKDSPLVTNSKTVNNISTPMGSAGAVYSGVINSVADITLPSGITAASEVIGDLLTDTDAQVKAKAVAVSLLYDVDTAQLASATIYPDGHGTTKTWVVPVLVLDCEVEEFQHVSIASTGLVWYISSSGGGGTGTYICKVGAPVSGIPYCYNATIYPDGLLVAGEPIQVFQLQLASGEVIPVNTMTLCVKAGDNYYMQVPIWL